MAVQRKLPTKICEFLGCKLFYFTKIELFKAVFVCCTKEVNLILSLSIFPVQTTAHSQKVSCLDIGETGRVLVTGGADRLVNLFAIGNDKPIQVSARRSSWFCAKRNDDENEVKSLMSVGSVVVLFVFRH